MSRIAVLIPVLGRPERAQIVADSIRISSDRAHRILFLCSPDDPHEVSAYERTGAEVVVVPWSAGAGDFARKTNEGLYLTLEEFVFCGADDLTFCAGWDVEALAVADATGAGVIGTWDGANPLVMKGRHSTHSLVRRSYAEDPGAIWGSPGIYYEGYDHQCVDNELVEVAQVRGEWAFASDARVLHHHPIYDSTVAMDATYKKALAGGRDDIIAFRTRRLAWRSPRRVRV
jgi:hypothetical protein